MNEQINAELAQIKQQFKELGKREFELHQILNEKKRIEREKHLGNFYKIPLTSSSYMFFYPNYWESWDDTYGGTLIYTYDRNPSVQYSVSNIRIGSDAIKIPSKEFEKIKKETLKRINDLQKNGFYGKIN